MSVANDISNLKIANCQRGHSGQYELALSNSTGSKSMPIKVRPGTSVI